MTAAKALRLLLGLALGGLGGAAFAALHLPLPWLIGSLVAVAAGRLSGLPAEADPRLRNLFLGIIGIALGLYFTPATAAVLGAKAGLLLLAAIVTLAMGAALAPLLAKRARVDMATAWFSSIPGGVADMAMLAESYGGRPAPVALAQLLRVCSVVVLVPNLFALAGLKGDVPQVATILPFQPGILALQVAGGLAAGFLLVRLGVRAGWMLGPLAVTAALTASGVTLSGIPAWLSAVAQVVLGASLGAAFGRETIRPLRRFLPHAVMQVFLLMAGCAVAAGLMAWLFQEPLGAMILGTAPGGVAEMSLTGKVLGMDVALIVTLHVTRIFLVTVLTPPVFRLLHHRKGRE
ncbi:AbrB family transcriptional regulator [Roseomonas terrae]|jgi:membrane AbrB-like protein|uniref:AbrB family transcriptional regulator n=1 Tax=Neoroseomonas terrae TaxID=424799 RepID=A0ABS5ENQ2_9PROT|nr:AbrB family transcriptional regulator [Neoroseomonas terrae]MBR0652663.1 AbrB family transcriptional regulator [Neoroseomonas terrae]